MRVLGKSFVIIKINPLLIIPQLHYIHLISVIFRKKFVNRDLNIIHLNYVIALILALLAFIAYSGLFFAKVKLEADVSY